MPAWPGGPCPACGEEMPENLIHCQNCRALLNTDLDPDSVEIPEFMPLREIESMVDVEPRGYFVGCPACRRELRINRKYTGQRVQCKYCAGQFELNLSNPKIGLNAIYAECPHCHQELRAHYKYLGAKVACRHCNGKIHFVESLS